MHRQIKAISISHRNAPLNIRELFALDREEINSLLRFFKEFTPVLELMIISTCNRVEVYYSANQDLGPEIVKRMGVEKGITGSANYQGYFEYYNEPQRALKHLFQMSMGLESRVLGDLQIITQVKTAYQQSADAGTAGPFLHRAMHTIFQTHKRVIRETQFKDGAASVPYTTFKLIRELAPEFDHPRILLLGSGKMGSEIARYLSKTGLQNVWLCNRSLNKVQSLAEECGFQAIPLKQGLKDVSHFDIVVSALSVKRPVIDGKLLKKKTSKTQYLIDLSVPRSISQGAELISGVKVFNIDTIREQVSSVLEDRFQVVPQVKAIVEESINSLNKWSADMAYAPTIRKMKEALEHIRQQELRRYLQDIPPESRKAMEAVTKNMIHKIVKLPVLKLKSKCQRDQVNDLSEALVQLFDLDSQKKGQP